MNRNRASRLLVSWSIVLVMVVGGLLAGCGTAQHPEAALREYVDNVRERRAGDIYDSLGPELRAEMSREQFTAFFDENYDEVLAQAEDIERALDNDKLDIVAALPVDDHDELALQYDNGENSWRLVDDVPAVAGASSPRGTLVALAGAIESNDLEAILLLLSSEKSDTLKAELNILRAGLAGVDEDDIIINGETATVYLDWGVKLELVFEDGAWRMQRLDQQ